MDKNGKRINLIIYLHCKYSSCVKSVVNPLQGHFLSFMRMNPENPYLPCSRYVQHATSLVVFSYHVLKLFVDVSRVENSLYIFIKDLGCAKFLSTRACQFSLQCSPFYSQPPLLISIINNLLL